MEIYFIYEFYVMTIICLSILHHFEIIATNSAILAKINIISGLGFCMDLISIRFKNSISIRNLNNNSKNLNFNKLKEKQKKC